MKIDFANLQYHNQFFKEKIDMVMQAVVNESNYIMRDDVKVLKENLEEFRDVKYATTCASGTDILLLVTMVLDKQSGDEIITSSFTFMATAKTIAFLKVKLVFVDMDEKTYNIDSSKAEEKITVETKAILPVSLYGQRMDIDATQVIPAWVQYSIRIKNTEQLHPKLKEEGTPTTVHYPISLRFQEYFEIKYIRKKVNFGNY